MPLTQRHYMRLAGALALGFMLSGCGFQLRGATAVPEPLDPVFVDCAGNTPPGLCEQVTELLELNQITVPERVTPESYVLRLSDFERSQRATAITASAAAAEYDLRLSSSLSLLAPGEVPLLADATVTANEVYRYDEDNVLAKRREQQALTEQLYQRLAQQIVYRLSPFTAEEIESLREAYLRAQQPEDPDPAATPPAIPAN